MDDWQKRVIVEFGELRTRLIALRSFIDRDGFIERPQRAVRLLLRQEASMTDYLHVLSDRIDGFEE